MKKGWIGILFLIFGLAGFLVWRQSEQSRLPLNSAPESENGEFEPEKSEKPSDWFWRQRAYPLDTINIAAYHEAVDQARRLRQEYAAQDEVIWEEAGPSNIGGRITALGIHPSQPSVIYAGAADGGVLKSTNSGSTWTPIFDATGALSIGAIAIDPADANTIWVGTGEANTSGDSYPGDGIYRSTNGGSTWQHMGLEDSYHIGRIAIDPTNSQKLFAAACGALFTSNPERGIYRTLNGGTTWERVLYLTDTTAAIDVVINPQNPQMVYAAMWERIRHLTNRNVGGMTSGIWRSTNGGDSWAQLTSGLPPNSPTVGRIGLTISPSNPLILYAIYANHPGDLMGVWKTTNGGDTWTATTSPSSSLYNGFGWYFGNIYADPVDAQKVYVLGVPLRRSTNGGSSWSTIAGSVHVDHHAFWINPNNTNQIWDGNDGGAYYSTNGGTGWTKCYNLHISQFYDIEIDELLPQRLHGGTQDNGTLRTLTGSLSDWTMIYGGDGFKVEVDYTNSNIIYAEYQYGEMAKSTNGGSSFGSCLSGVSSSDRRNWDTPFVMDPSNHNTLYYGTYRLYKTTNAAGSWTAISSDLTDGVSGGNLIFNTITTIAAAPTDGQVVYVGTDDGNVWVTQNGGSSWTAINGSLPDRWITRVAVSPQNAGICYVTLSGYRIGEPLPHVFRSTNYGAAWTDISGNLPEAPVNCIIEDAQDPQQLFIASDVGVYYTANLGASWLPLGGNLPICGIMDLKLHDPTRKIVAGTHGRSMYKAILDSLVSYPDVQITMAPTNPPVQIPSSGGNFSFDVQIINNETSSQSFDGWIMQQLPDGTWQGPMLGPVPLILGAGGTIARNRNQSVPGSAPPGIYLYCGYVGDYSAIKWDSSFFNYTKLSTGSGEWVGAWLNTGEPFPDEVVAARDQFPTGSALLGAFPNPFNATTAISFQLSANSYVNLRIYDTAGRLVSELANGWREAGAYKADFDGLGLPSGIYLCRLQAGDLAATQKLVLMK
jgi:photosystem II stability/assembly factor-like uncharacterized protein